MKTTGPKPNYHPAQFWAELNFVPPLGGLAHPFSSTDEIPSPLPCRSISFTLKKEEDRFLSFPPTARLVAFVIVVMFVRFRDAISFFMSSLQGRELLAGSFEGRTQQRNPVGLRVESFCCCVLVGQVLILSIITILVATVVLKRGRFASEILVLPLFVLLKDFSLFL